MRSRAACFRAAWQQRNSFLPSQYIISLLLRPGQAGMGLLSKSSASGSGSSKGVVQAPGSAAEGGKFSYSQYVEGGKGPSQSALSTAASYKRGPTAALQVQLESSRQRSQRLSGSSGFPEQPPLDSAVCRPARLWMHCLSLMQVAVAVALIAVVASCLNRQEKMAAPVDEQGASLPASYSVCYATTRSTNLCWWVDACSALVAAHPDCIHASMHGASAASTRSVFPKGACAKLACLQGFEGFMLHF